MTRNKRRDLAIILFALGVFVLLLVVIFQYVAIPNLDLATSAAFFVVVCTLLVVCFALGFIVLSCIAIPVLQVTLEKEKAE